MKNATLVHASKVLYAVLWITLIVLAPALAQAGGEVVAAIDQPYQALLLVLIR